MVGSTLSHFRIQKKLGEGGMGVVYRAEDVRLERAVALKLLRPGFVADEERRARFVREARTAAGLSHPNIATIHEIDEANGTTFIAMELVEGETLRDRLRRQGVSLGEAVRITADVASALAKAHAAGVIHRDLKPDNVMITPEGHVKILDFGLAKLLDDGGTGGAVSSMETVPQHLTREGRVLGTAAYMSPEQARGRAIDARSDLFSLGVMLYELTTGRVPFRGDTISDTISAVLRDPAVPAIEMNPTVPVALDQTLARLLQKEPNDRWPDARTLHAELTRLLADGTLAGAVGPSPAATASSGPRAGGWSGYGTPTPSSYGTKTPSGSGSGPITADAGAPWKAVLIGGALALALVVVGVFLGPRLRGTEPLPSAARGEPNTIAVHALENLKDPEDPDRLGQILQELLITDLTGRGPLEVVSSQRLFDIQKLITGERTPRFDRAVATEVAERAGAGLMLTGSLSRLGERWIVTAQLVDVGTGTIRGSERVDGTDLYAMVDDVAEGIRGKLNLAAVPPEGRGRSVREMTTSSIEAYRLYLAGIEHLNAQAFDEAVAALDSAVTIDPAFARAHYELGLALWWENDRPEDARAALEKLTTGELEVTARERHMAEAAIHLVERDYTAAVSAYEKLAATYPEEKDAWYGLGEAYYHKASPDKNAALRAFVRSVKLDPSFFLGYRHVFDIYQERGMYDEAAALARVVKELDPDRPQNHARLVEYLAGAGKDREAEAVIDEAIRRFPEDLERASLLVGVGWARAGSGRSAEAEAAFREALSIGDASTRLEAMQGLARAAENERDLDAAESWYREAIALDPSAPSTLRLLSQLYYRTGRFPEGAELTERFPGVERSPFAHIPDVVGLLYAGKTEAAARMRAVVESTYADAGNFREELIGSVGYTCMACGDYEGAEDSFQTLEAGGFVLSTFQLALSGYAALALEDLAGAEARLTRSHAESPGNTLALSGLALLEARRGRPLAGLAHVGRGLERHPTDPSLHALAVSLLVQATRPASADSALAVARARLSDRAYRHVLTGYEAARPTGVVFTYARAGMDARVDALLETAARLPGPSYELPTASGWVALHRGNAKAAVGSFERAVRESKPISSERLVTSEGLAIARFHAGDPSGAERLLEQQLASGPMAVRLHRHLAYVLASMGRFEEARDHAERAFEKDPGVDSHDALAWVLVSGEIDVARGVELASWSERAGETPGRSVPVRLGHLAPPEHTLGLAAMHEGRLADAVAFLTRVERDHPERTGIQADLEAARRALAGAQG